VKKGFAVQTRRIKLSCFKRTLGILQHPVPLDFTYGKVSKDDEVGHEVTNVFDAILVAT
jgi:DUF1365 family protein